MPKKATRKGVTRNKSASKNSGTKPHSVLRIMIVEEVATNLFRMDFRQSCPPNAIQYYVTSSVSGSGVGVDISKKAKQFSKDHGNPKGYLTKKQIADFINENKQHFKFSPLKVWKQT